MDAWKSVCSAQYYFHYTPTTSKLHTYPKTHKNPQKKKKTKAGNTFEKDSWGLPMRAKSSKQRCPALCILDLSYNVKYRWSCRVGGCYGHLTASGSWHGFPGVDHEGRQDIAVSKVTSKFFSRSILWRINNLVQCNKMESKSHTA